MLPRHYPSARGQGLPLAWEALFSAMRDRCSGSTSATITSAMDFGPGPIWINSIYTYLGVIPIEPIDLLPSKHALDCAESEASLSENRYNSMQELRIILRIRTGSPANVA